MLRNHTCGELTEKELKKEVTLCGWVHSRRDHGGVIFLDLRDRYGLTQIVFEPKDKKLFEQADKLRREYVIQVKGVVRERPKGMTNPKLHTGKIEVLCHELNVLNASKVPPLEIDDRIVANEDVRLEYRYLDLRRPSLQKNLILRHNAAQATREFLSSKGFIEIETPLLVRATPEGARDYLVPSRVNPGKMYALPQSPQLYKQILMVSGMDKYFQICKCLRDEDLRQDRQPEFTQIDVEMSFLEEEDIYSLCEGLMQFLFKKVINKDIKIPFTRLKYDDAMERYGCDKPDLRFGLELVDVSETMKECEYTIFKEILKHNGIIKCMNVEKNLTRKELDELTEFAIKNGAKGLTWMRVTEKGLESNVVKYFSPELQKKLINKIKPKKDSILLFVADNKKRANEVLSKIRNELGLRLKLYDPNEFKFCWVTDFPLFEWDEDNECWSPAHHIFTMPKAETMKYLETDPGKVYGILYDLVLNGTELLSGSIRIHRADIQQKVMNVIGLTKQEAEKKFGFLLKAFDYGAPPHGGFAFGFDRIVGLMCGTHDIREVIAFPKNKAAQCPMDGSPSDVDDKQMKELHLKFDVVKK